VVRIRGSMRGVVGEEGTVENTGHTVLGVSGWQGKEVVALAKARTAEDNKRKYWSVYIHVGLRGWIQR